MLIDRTRIIVKSGIGGKGCESIFHRKDKKLIPDGGDGGKGGDVLIRADQNVSGLKFFQNGRVYEAGRGNFGSSNQKTGRAAEDLILKVPCGTTIMSSDEQFLIRDLTQHGDEVILCKGGRGGAGNQHGKQTHNGRPGEEQEIILDYTIVADVFMVGLPNSGKSSILKAISNSGVTIEEYPFSTRFPLLGTYENDLYQRVSFCELPSLEKGSNEGKGLGNRFLKHLKRAKLIWVVLDWKSKFVEDILEGKQVIENQIELFNPDFLSIPRFYIVNKSDLKEGGEKGKIKKLGTHVYDVSATTEEGIDQLKHDLDQALLEQERKEKNEEESNHI